MSRPHNLVRGFFYACQSVSFLTGRPRVPYVHEFSDQDIVNNVTTKIRKDATFIMTLTPLLAPWKRF